MADVNTAGYQALGSALTGGGELPATIGYDQGALVGAKTQEAMLAAQSERDRQTALAQAPDLLTKAGVDPQSQALIMTGLRTHTNPKELADTLGTQFNTAMRQKISDSDTSNPDRFHAGAAIDPTLLGHQFETLGDNGVANNVQSGVAQTPYSTAATSQKNAQASLENAEAANNPHVGGNTMGLTGPVDPQVAAHFGDQVHNGTMQMSNFTGRLAAYAPAVATYMAQEYPDFDLGDTQAVKTAGEKSWMGNGINAQKVNSVNTLVPHMDLARQMMTALDNGDNQTVNDMSAKWKAWTGQPAPTNAQQVAQVFGPELTRFVSPATSTGEERAGAQSAMALVNSPGQSSIGFDQLDKLVAGRMNGLRQARINDHGSDDLDNRLVPMARSKYGKTTAGQDAGTAPAAVAPAANPALTAALAQYGVH